MRAPRSVVVVATVRVTHPSAPRKPPELRAKLCNSSSRINSLLFRSGGTRGAPVGGGARRGVAHRVRGMRTEDHPLRRLHTSGGVVGRLFSFFPAGPTQCITLLPPWRRQCECARRGTARNCSKSNSSTVNRAPLVVVAYCQVVRPRRVCAERGDGTPTPVR